MAKNDSRARNLVSVSATDLEHARNLEASEPETLLALIRAVREIADAKIDADRVDHVVSLAALQVARAWDTLEEPTITRAATLAVSWASKSVAQTMSALAEWEDWDITGGLSEEWSPEEALDALMLARSWPRANMTDAIARTTPRDLIDALLAEVGDDTLTEAAAAFMAHDPIACEKCSTAGRRPTIRGILAHGRETTDSERMKISRTIGQALERCDLDTLDWLISELFDTRAPRRMIKWPTDYQNPDQGGTGSSVSTSGPSPDSLPDTSIITVRRKGSDDVAVVSDPLGNVIPPSWSGKRGTPDPGRKLSRIERTIMPEQATGDTAPASASDRAHDGTVRSFKALVTPSPRKRPRAGATGPTVPTRL